MPDYKHYRESISNELISTKDRVRDFVQHFPEDGRYKEIKGDFKQIIKKAHDNGEMIVQNTTRTIFNGIFGYESDLNNLDANLSDSIANSLNEYHGQVNHICFGKDIFMRYWSRNMHRHFTNNEHCGFYNLKNLAFGYFISNLLESVMININQNGCYACDCVQHTDVFYQYLYPLIENGGKEYYSIEHWKVLFD